MFLMGANKANDILAVEDVFSAYTYTGNGSTQTITNGIDLAGKGGMVWLKGRGAVTAHDLYDTVRTRDYLLSTNMVGGSQGPITAGNDLSSFGTTGFNLGVNEYGISNTNAATYVAWSFAQGNKFFKVATATVAGGVTATVDLSSLGTVGMVTVKQTNGALGWVTYHRSCTSGKLVYLNTTAAETTDGSVTLSGTTLSLVGGVIANGTYIVYAWAHDSSATGVVQCGSFTTDGSGNASVNLGWEPQFLFYKPSSVVGGSYFMDQSRAWPGYAAYNLTKTLSPETSSAESSTSQAFPTATGFKSEGYLAAVATYVYLAIRRPNKPPTTGTQVYNALDLTGTGGTVVRSGVGFAPDLVINHAHAADQTWWVDKLRGRQTALGASNTNAETTASSATQDVVSFDPNGVTLGIPNTTGFNNTSSLEINWFFKRAPGVFDVVCYTGTGLAMTVAHNLGVAPELMIVKKRNSGTYANWAVYVSSLGNTGYAFLESTAASTTNINIWNSTTPTASVFTVGSVGQVNAVSDTFVTYLFATLAGISKVGSYSGNNSSQTINCGFTTGARFILIKRTDSTGDWYVYDTTREGGSFPAGNDKHLSLNTTAAEVATTDDIDADTSGFIVNQNATTNLNITGGSYIYLAFS